MIPDEGNDYCRTCAEPPAAVPPPGETWTGNCPECGRYWEMSTVQAPAGGTRRRQGRQAHRRVKCPMCGDVHRCHARAQYAYNVAQENGEFPLE